VDLVGRGRARRPLPPANGGVEDAIDSAYRDKYGASSNASQRIIAPLARDTTIRLAPAGRN
jgi:hypothetical protein